MNFLEQFELLRQKVPHIGIQSVQNENSPYCQYTEKSKNCYMTFASFQDEDCLYNHRVFYCRDTVDCALCHKCELCYECIDCINCYNCNYCDHMENAIDCDYSLYCIGTNNCFGCVGLNRKSFCIFNEQFTKEEYKARLPELRKMPAAELAARMETLLTTVPRVATYGRNNEGSYGEDIHNCKNCFWAFDSKDLHDCTYAYFCHDNSKNLIDCSHFGFSESCYQIMSGGYLHDCMFCMGSWYGNNLTYCELVYNSHDCFGCVSRNHAEYEILNVKYPKEEYFKRVAEIIDSMKADGTWGRWYASTYPEVLTYGL